jgi:hypothetical protein
MGVGPVLRGASDSITKQIRAAAMLLVRNVGN